MVQFIYLNALTFTEVNRLSTDGIAAAAFILGPASMERSGSPNITSASFKRPLRKVMVSF